MFGSAREPGKRPGDGSGEASDSDEEAWGEPTGDPEFDELFDELRDQLGFGSRRGAGQAGKQPGSRLKELYRALARRLHPDAQAEMTPEKKEWWHQAQAAYEDGDEEQLEVILTLCEIGEQGSTAQTSASVLHRITEQLRRTLRQIKHQIGTYRGDPAWNFSRLANHDRIVLRMRRILQCELETLRVEECRSSATIDRWKAAAEKLQRRKRRGPRRRSSGR